MDYCTNAVLGKRHAPPPLPSLVEVSVAAAVAVKLVKGEGCDVDISRHI
jgi:hypothetical protein